jgi:hypothetical protein
MTGDRLKDPEPNARRCYFPPDMAVLFGANFIIVPIALVCAWFLPLLSRFKSAGDPTLVLVALALGAIGVALLFAARLPLYQQRRFFLFGSRQLDEEHRRLYRWAYKFVGASVGLLILLLMMC